ncbi:hypothetical protein [Streptomyces sp. NPDC004546]|uniref:hypothetical protein n=1 Tax=Streptomyces sp. NPDC004546 TaxID=3154282 RepID=UPI0033A308B2
MHRIVMVVVLAGICAAGCSSKPASSHTPSVGTAVSPASSVPSPSPAVPACEASAQADKALSKSGELLVTAVSLSDETLTAAGRIVKQAQDLKSVSQSVCELETGSIGKPNRETVCHAAKELYRDGDLRAQAEAENAADEAELAQADDIATFKRQLDAVASPASAGTIALLGHYCDDPLS